MARKMTAREALARACFRAVPATLGFSFDERPAETRAFFRRLAGRRLRELGKLGFTIVPRRPTRKGRKK